MSRNRRKQFTSEFLNTWFHEHPNAVFIESKFETKKNKLENRHYDTDVILSGWDDIDHITCSKDIMIIDSLTFSDIRCINLVAICYGDDIPKHTFHVKTMTIFAIVVDQALSKFENYTCESFLIAGKILPKKIILKNCKIDNLLKPNRQKIVSKDSVVKYVKKN